MGMSCVGCCCCESLSRCKTSAIAMFLRVSYSSALDLGSFYIYLL